MFNINVLRRVLVNQREWIKFSKDWVIRDKIDEVENYISLPHIIVITGPRRSGKSVFLSQIIHKYYNKSNFYYISFDDERLTSLSIDDTDILMEEFRSLFGEAKVIFMDEIQNFKGWERFVSRLYNEKYKIFLTGSNTNLLSSELATHLTGRNLPIEIMPFSFNELLKFKKIKYDTVSFYRDDVRLQLKKCLDDYLKYGGFPEVVIYNNSEILKNYFSDIIDKDVIKRYQVREKATLREIGLFLLTNAAGEVSYDKLRKRYKMGSVHTVKNYVEYIVSSYLVSIIQKFEFSVAKQQVRSRKVYPVDIGLFNVMNVSGSDDIGKLYETAVFLKLKNDGKDIHFYKNENDKEVDFVVSEKGRVKELLQVCYDISDEDTYKREVNNLFYAMKKFNIKESLLITQTSLNPIINGKFTIDVVGLLEYLMGMPSIA